MHSPPPAWRRGTVKNTLRHEALAVAHHACGKARECASHEHPQHALHQATRIHRHCFQGCGNGNDEPRASRLGEIHPSREFYDYAAKYLDGTSRLDLPARLDAGLTERIRRQSLIAFRALDLQGFARVDFLVERTGESFYLNEVNTLPGFTPISMFPKLWEASGLPYPDLIVRLVGLAIDRRRREAELTTSWQPG